MFSSLLRQISPALKKGGSFYKLHTLSSSQTSLVKTCSIPASSNGLTLKLTSTLDYMPNIKTINPLVLNDPLSKNNCIKEIPLLPVLSYIDKITWNKIIEEPTEIIEKQAARLIVIRRRKMKRHKLKKLRRKMKFEWAKARQRRELRKEKLFQAELMGKIKETEKFDPRVYAAEKIKKANEVLLPKLWRGKRQPEFVIKELIVESNNKKAKNIERIERRKKISLKVSDYKV